MPCRRYGCDRQNAAKTGQSRRGAKSGQMRSVSERPRCKLKNSLHMSLHTQLEELLNRVMPVVKQFHSKAMYAPHAATMDSAGDVTGRAFTSDGTSNLTVGQSLVHFESGFAELARKNEIHASGIFYHGAGMNSSSGVLELPPAETEGECVAVVGLLEHISGQSVYLYIPYSGERDAIEYATGKLIAKPQKVFAVAPTQQPWWKIW